jgi:hypothetical protein
MIDEHFVWVGVGLLFIGGGMYVRDIIAGTVRPNVVTWFLWALAPLIAFAAQLQQGVGSAAWLTFAVGFCPAVICVAAVKKGFIRLTTLDYICGGMSLLALVAWQLSHNPMWAIIFSILADCLAAVPTLIKSFRDPSSESPLLFLLFMVSAILTLLAVKQWTLENVAFALYILVLYTVLFILVRFKIGALVPPSRSIDAD